MKGKKRFGALFAIAILCAAALPMPAHGAATAKPVNVTLPTYAVTINGVGIDHSKSKYPFIVYNNITYFPMTYSDCRFLGLETQWKGNAEGLMIEKTGITAAYLPASATAANKGSYKATIATFPIKVNGKTIDNSLQQYPLLSFRDITYFPMTWEFGVDAFGWDYSFSAKEGLVIVSDNTKLAQKSFGGSDILKDAGGKISNATVTKNYIYYQDKKGRIMQAPLSEPTKAKAVYQLPIWSYQGDSYVNNRLYIENGTAYLYYHQGGATMGSDHILRLNDAGSTTELQNSYSKVKIFGDKTFSYWTGGAPGAGNLFMKVGDEYKPVGSPDCIYGWAWSADEEGSGGSGSDDVVLDGENLYILAFNTKKDGEKNGIYRVNIDTDETVRMSHHEAMGFQREGEYLYYQSEGSLYRISLKSGNEEFVKQLTSPADEIGRLAVLGGKAYWQKASDENLYNEEGKNVNDGARLLGVKIAGDQSEYLLCTFAETAQSKYRIMAFDKSGTVVFKTSDIAAIHGIDIIGETVIFVNQTTGTICSGKLK